MSHKAQDIKLLGIALLAALSLMAMSAVAAQAETYSPAEIR